MLYKKRFYLMECTVVNSNGWLPTFGLAISAVDRAFVESELVVHSKLALWHTTNNNRTIKLLVHVP